jgi:hypothetical protein
MVGDDEELEAKPLSHLVLPLFDQVGRDDNEGSDLRANQPILLDFLRAAHGPIGPLVTISPVRYPEANYGSRPVCPDDPLVTQAVPLQQRAVPAISDCPNPTQGRLDIPLIGTPSSPAPGGTPVITVGVTHWGSVDFQSECD